MKNNQTDLYWKSLFEDAATGKFPRNFKFNDNILSYRNKNKTIELKIPSDLEEADVLVKNFIYDNASIISPEDLKKRRAEEEEKMALLSTSEITSWSQIRSDKQQYLLISIFVENIGKVYNLSMDEKLGLIQKIKIGILAGYFNSSNIIISENQIMQIEGLEYNTDDKDFHINTSNCKPTANKKLTTETTFETPTDGDETENLNGKKNFYKKWQKYLNEMYRKYY
jgi:hypothetical protein